MYRRSAVTVRRQTTTTTEAIRTAAIPNRVPTILPSRATLPPVRTPRRVVTFHPAVVVTPVEAIRLPVAVATPVVVTLLLAAAVVIPDHGAVAASPRRVVAPVVAAPFTAVEAAVRATVAVEAVRTTTNRPNIRG